MKLRLWWHNAKLAFTAMVMKLMPASSYMTFVGPDSAAQLCAHVGRTGATRVLVVTDRVLVELGVVERALRGFEAFDVEIVVFDEVMPDPTYAVVVAGANVARERRSEVVFAIGGGSSIDVAKIIAEKEGT